MGDTPPWIGAIENITTENALKTLDLPLSGRMLLSAATIDELNQSYDFPTHTPWTAESLRAEALVVASEQAEQ